jgi:MraZ protein
MLGIIGEYEITFDTKGRFLLPAGFKKKLTGETANQFVFTRSKDGCIRMYPRQSWEPIYKKLASLNEFDAKVRLFIRGMMDGLAELELDSAGRILVPKKLLEHAGITKDAVLVSTIEKFEIWDVKRYREMLDAVSKEEYNLLEYEVMVLGAQNKTTLPDNG